MRRAQAAALLVLAATAGCVPLVTTGARTYEETVSPEIGFSLPLPIVWNADHYTKTGAPERAVFFECSIEASSPDEDDLLAQWCFGVGTFRNYGPFGRNREVWEGVSAGISRLSLADDSGTGFYVAAGTFHAAWGGILLRYTFGPTLDGSYSSHGTTGATIAYYWGWLPSMVFLEAVGN
jgi:hypothetical protein